KNICIKLCEGYEPQILETGDCSYTCNCSRERMEKGLISLGRSEIEDIIHEQGEAELQCHFCNSKYYFSKEQLEELLKKI
ncbi:MAG: Hsp33 family molecular chaperone HslO, partial [Clostridiales bacterium]|nr:Hsp33 family molecular chaperone HslO [Clostridiales bacterium]